MKPYRILTMAAAAGIALTLSGCGNKADAGPAVSTAPAVELTKLIDEAAPADTAGAKISILNLENPIDFCYSSADTDMIFKWKEGTWIDAMDTAIPLNQERFDAMAQGFLKLSALTKEDQAQNLEAYGLDSPAYTVYITDGQKGETNISIGDRDAAGNYYASLDDGAVYTIPGSLGDSLIFDYNSLVIRDSLDLNVTAADLKSVVITAGGETVQYKPSDTEAMTRIASGISRLKPQEFASYYAQSQELVSAELTEDARMTFQAELTVNGETRSLTVYVGGFANAEGTLCYVQLAGSRMIGVAEYEIVSELLNLQEAE
ncbi:MAG: DUF4340 domain-containing protein [Lachnospiraceae bacterium]|nr:DUF4340 domain-containing protein [Lachnospiraceae bacterium]